MIGNSLTQDSRPDTYPVFFQNDHEMITVDNNIVGSATLTSQYNSPSGGWPTELPAQLYDVITFQPFVGTGATIGSEAEAVEAMVITALSGPTDDPELYIYEGWPGNSQAGGNFTNYWNASVVDDDATNFTQKRQATDYLLNRVRANVDADFKVIPTGEVFKEIDQRAKAGQMEGFDNVFDIYRDDIHVGDVGHYAAAVTIYCTVQGKPLDDATRWRLFALGSGTVPLTATLAAQIEDAVWDVVSNDPRTGVN